MYKNKKISTHLIGWEFIFTTGDRLENNNPKLAHL
jgi:hypothetical protein